MPEMNENVLAKYAIFGIMGIVLSFNGAKYTGTTKPVHNQVGFENGFCLIFSLRKLFEDHLYGLLWRFMEWIAKENSIWCLSTINQCYNTSDITTTNVFCQEKWGA